jgi:hypothetical protein
MSDDAVPAQAGSGGDPKADDRPAEEGLNVVTLLLASIGGGIGVLGFVAFFGASILWVRMDRAGLPGNDAVALMPKSALIATGASFLAPALLAALGFTALLYLVEVASSVWRKASIKELENRFALMRVAAKEKQEEAKRARDRADRARRRSVEASKDLEEAISEGAANESLRRVTKAVQEDSEDTEQSQRHAQQAALEAEREAAKEARTVTHLQAEQTAAIESLRAKVRVAVIGLLFLVGFVLTLTVASVGLPPGRLGILLALLVLLGLVCLAVLSGTGNFAWFALAAFVSAGLVAGFVTYYRTFDNPKVEPVALLRDAGGPLYGFFVAQSSDRIYIGVTHADGLPQLAAVPRDEVTDLAIGALEESKDATAEARQMALDLCLQGNRRAERLENGSRTSLTSPELPKIRPCDSTDFQELKSWPVQTSS